ncbi:hypothetical protein [Afifella sp. YEN Y35]|uniref:hypothetical protein n=1 Tax=Afifella sp. YEN Y35 TaxID=3388337 RepID=UPI0039E1AF3E
MSFGRAMPAPSAALLNSPLMRKAPPPTSFLDELEAGAVPTPAAIETDERQRRGLSRQIASERRAAAYGRRRKMGGSGRMPDRIRAHYTEGERAALTVVAIEVKRHGRCELTNDAIASRAGVCRRTVQYALGKASENGHVDVIHRPQRGRKSKPNVVQIVARDWLAWLRFEKPRSNGPRPKAIGCKAMRTKENREINHPRDWNRTAPTSGKGGWSWDEGRRAERLQLEPGGRSHAA